MQPHLLVQHKQCLCLKQLLWGPINVEETPVLFGPKGSTRIALPWLVERLEEELTDQVSLYNDMSVDVTVGEPLPVSTKRPPRGEADPLMVELRTSMLNLMGVEDQWPLESVKDLDED